MLRFGLVRSGAWVVPVLGAALFTFQQGAGAALVPFSRDLAGFTAAAGDGSVAIDFEDLTDGTDVGGQTINGATFTAVGSPLVVVPASSTASSSSGYARVADGTNRLFADTGGKVLSPGGALLGSGADPAIENDDLRIDFDAPVGYFGLAHLSQRADGTSFTRVSVYNVAGEAILDNQLVPISRLPSDEQTGIMPGGIDFWGIVSDADDIRTIVFNEFDQDANAPDNNIGYDSLRFGWLNAPPPPPPPPLAIPLPPALLTAPALAALAALARRIRLV